MAAPPGGAGPGGGAGGAPKARGTIWQIWGQPQPAPKAAPPEPATQPRLRKLAAPRALAAAPVVPPVVAETHFVASDDDPGMCAACGFEEGAHDYARARCCASCAAVHTHTHQGSA